MNQPHRNFVRVPFDATTHASQDGQKWTVQLLDISLNGVLFEQPDEWLINPRKAITIDVELNEETHIVMDARLVHTTATTVGCQCEHIDVDSITQLKRLIELNTGSDGFLERELSALMEEQTKAH